MQLGIPTLVEDTHEQPLVGLQGEALGQKHQGLIGPAGNCEAKGAGGQLALANRSYHA